jgi:4-methyl-5(b-hydroxyethyl)-thiazole monophosphate biosynthesis
MKAFVFLATGFEELEAVGTIDILRRGDIETVTVSITGDKTVVGVHGIPVIADKLFEDTDYTHFDALVLPGGGPGSEMLNQHEGLRKALVDSYENNKLLAAICASPRVFGSLGLLNGKKATCYPGIEPELIGATIVHEPIVTEHNIITGRGPGLVMDFGFAILNYLKDNPCDVDDVAEAMLL